MSGIGVLNEKAVMTVSDLISRQDAIRWVKTECNPYGKPTLDFESGKRVMEHLEQMPSADRPQGEWMKFGLGRGTRILFCTNCERRIEVPLSQGDSNYDFCPNCGARMKGADDE